MDYPTFPFTAQDLPPTAHFSFQEDAFTRLHALLSQYLSLLLLFSSAHVANTSPLHALISVLLLAYLHPQMLLQPVRTRFLFHFLYNASTNTISNTHYYILYIQNFSQFYLPFFTRLLQSLFPQTDLSSILVSSLLPPHTQTEFFAQLVVILRLRLDPDLDSIIHNQLQLDDDAFSSLQDASRSLFQSLLSHAMRFDDHTAALWGIRDASARLLSAFQQEAVFGYWVQADAELYGECWRELGLEKAEAKVVCGGGNEE